jgi:hypothetical protein
MDKEAETVINKLLANKKLADDLFDFLTNENQKLREQAHYHYENGLKKDVEIDRLREALRTIRDGARDVEKSYADLQQKDKDSE